MAQDQSIDEDSEGWEFDLAEQVKLVWTPKHGQVVGRTEYIHRDVQYLVEFVDDTGSLVQRWVYGDCLEHITTITTKH